MTAPLNLEFARRIESAEAPVQRGIANAQCVCE